MLTWKVVWLMFSDDTILLGDSIYTLDILVQDICTCMSTGYIYIGYIYMDIAIWGEYQSF